MILIIGILEIVIAVLLLIIGFFVIYLANREDNPILLIYVVSFFISASILIVKNPLLMGL